MKTKINTWAKALYALLMTILGFSACDEIIEARVEYGQPHADYKLIGDVKSQDGTPIKGIRVVFNPQDNALAHPSYVLDTLYSDSNGKFSKERLKYDWPDDLNNATITFEDIDGSDNGGEFETVSLQNGSFSVEQVKKGDGNWYHGEFLITANAVMTGKKQD